MKALKTFTAALVVFVLAGIPARRASAQNPTSQPSETVARPKKKDAPPPDATTPEPPAPDPSAPSVTPDQPKIPSQFSTKGKEVPEGTPTFRSDVTTVQV